MGCLPHIRLFPINEIRVKVLESADIIAGYVIKLFIVYLNAPSSIGGDKNSSQESNNVPYTLSYMEAAAVVNVFWGLAYMLPIVFSHVARASPKAEFRVLCYSSFSYCLGLGLLLLSCSKEGMKKPGAFYASLLFLATGISGQSTTRKSFEKKQKAAGWLCGGHCTRCLVEVIAFLGVQMAGTMIDFISSWPIKYGAAAAYMVMAILIFLTGICCCRFSYEEVQESNPLKSLINFVVALFSIAVAIIKCVCSAMIKLCVPSCIRSFLPSCLGGGKEDEEEPSTRSESERRKDTEITVHLIPMFMTFIICGVVCATAYTTLLAQAATMKHKRFLSFLLFFYSVGNTIGTWYSKISNWFLSLCDKKSEQRFAPTFGIGFAMLVSVLTTIIAAKVEARRQKNPGILSMWFLVPQSVFVGVLDGTYQVSINSFFVDGLSSTRKRDIPIFAKAVFGAGFMGNALLVFILSKATDWIPDKLESSGKLDKYYWLLVVLSSINLVVYILIAIWFNNKYLLATSSASVSGHGRPRQATEASEPEETDIGRERGALSL